jgi:hypothetical protein
MGSNLVIFLTYATMLVDGNPVTDVLSIGGKISETVLGPRPPAVMGGLDTRYVIALCSTTGIRVPSFDIRRY